MSRSKLILLSPLQGWSAPLEETPDAVFSGRMMGDGVAIDPTGSSLHAPCDGTVVVVPASKHAVTLRAANGAEILLHVGIDTVGLAGEGFELYVREGQAVRAGDRLLSFDLDSLARRATSLITPVLVTDSVGYSIARRSDNRSLNVGDFLMEVVPAADVAIVGAPSIARAGSSSGATVPEQAGRMPAQSSAERRVVVWLEHGIHARPAASLAAVAKAVAADVKVGFRGRNANAKSPVALMSLGVHKGDEIVLQAFGPDAESAVAALERALTAGKDSHAGAAMLAVRGGAVSAASARGVDASPGFSPPSAPARVPTPESAPVAVPAPAAASQSVATSTSDSALKGVVASRGIGVGTAFQFARASIAVAEQGTGVTRELAEFVRALATVRAELERARLERAEGSSHGAAREIAEAHLGLIDDPELVGGARAQIEKGKSAGFAWRTVLRASIEQLRALNDPRMAERADDLLDLETRVLSALTGHVGTAPDLPPESILIANELLPSQLVALDNNKINGICLAGGGATSHVSIIAAAMDIPTMVAAGAAALDVPTGTPVVLDAEAGWLYVNPRRVHIDLARNQLAEKRASRVAEQLIAQRECRTADGTRIEMFANVGSEAEAHAAVRNGAEGSGLLRTEFLFLERTQPPDESEQTDQYQRIASALEGRPLTIRTLDIGGDKPIPYLPLPHEENPALGLRGIRTSLWRPDLLRIQLRAILAVRPVGQCRILLPMITEPGEIRAVRAMLDGAPIAVGAMIETPASALMADRIAREADFISIGTNDLTQYTLAMDRGHAQLAARLDALHPAVLRLIGKTVEAAKVHGRMVAVCGGLASDPVAVPVLIGLGVQELSVIPAVIPQLKALIATLQIDECTTLAASALQRETAEEVRALAIQSVTA